MIHPPALALGDDATAASDVGGGGRARVENRSKAHGRDEARLVARQKAGNPGYRRGLLRYPDIRDGFRHPAADASITVHRQRNYDPEVRAANPS